ncbi:hypothetical protein PR048_012949 [Dryococelus australis]|uniref:Uncharacterized protein n=1 Tax=Dryococelus australis TaxID=614101 RepID=A0ABQ9HQU8_9NEOP|nr:hypothetical protein PR048_012949 [Dryococelus australis]
MKRSFLTIKNTVPSITNHYSQSQNPSANRERLVSAALYAPPLLPQGEKAGDTPVEGENNAWWGRERGDVDGLVVDEYHSFLGAPPDGLIGRDLKKSEFNDLQARLYSLMCKYADKTCNFIVWTPEGMVSLEIQQDKEFLENKMVTKLLTFFSDSLLPEINDPRHPRNMPISECPYIKSAQDVKRAKKKSRTRAIAETTKIIFTLVDLCGRHTLQAGVEPVDKQHEVQSYWTSIRA